MQLIAALVAESITKRSDGKVDLTCVAPRLRVPNFPASLTFGVFAAFVITPTDRDRGQAEVEFTVLAPDRSVIGRASGKHSWTPQQRSGEIRPTISLMGDNVTVRVERAGNCILRVTHGMGVATEVPFWVDLEGLH